MVGVSTRHFGSEGFRVWDLGFRVWGLGFRVWGLGFRILRNPGVSLLGWAPSSLKT